MTAWRGRQSGPSAAAAPAALPTHVLPACPAPDPSLTHPHPPYYSSRLSLSAPAQALADYMESKRRAFPRFYFVSTADLLNILSNGNDPAHVQQHMSKCFQV